MRNRTAATFKLYLASHKDFMARNEVTNARQSARVSIDELNRRIQMAEYDLPLGPAAIEAYKTDPDALKLFYRSHSCDTYLSSSMRHILFRSDSGFAAMIALIMVVMLALLGLAALNQSNDEVTLASNELMGMRAFYASESGLEIAAAALHDKFDSTGAPPTNMPSGIVDLNHCTVVYEARDEGPAVGKVLTRGTLAGLHALVKTFTMSSIATNAEDDSRVELSESFEASLIPIFQFAVFYDHSLWATPLCNMTIDGRVHVNGDMYIQAFAGLFFDSWVTSSGSVYHGLGNGQYPSATADVSFKDQAGVYRSMKESGFWLDAGDSHWYDSASVRWGGRVSDKAFGQESLNLPLTGSVAGPHALVERGAGNPDSYEDKADLKIIDGAVFTKVGGIWHDMTASLPPGMVQLTSFYDAREKEWVNSTDIDLSILNGSAEFPANGVIYASDQRAGFNATRLINGTELGAPLTVVCENQLYVQGDYNTSIKQPAAVLADAVTFLSNKWNDAESDQSLSDRSASATTVNLSFITGDTEPTGSNYGGGLENLPRFLEDWDSEEFKFRGSMVTLWRSQQSAGDWRYSSPEPYYTAPSRNWGFDFDLDDPSKLPPLTPTVRVFSRLRWKQEYVEY